MNARVSGMVERREIKIINYGYEPNIIEIVVGQEVVWVNHDSVRHTATSTEDPKFETGRLKKGESSKPITFEAPTDADGIKYFCKPHPYMTGKIIVRRDASDSEVKTLERKKD